MATQFYHVVQSDPKLSKVVQNCPKWSKIVQSGPKVSKMVQKCQKWSKSFQSGPQLSKVVQKCPKWYKCTKTVQSGTIIQSRLKLTNEEEKTAMNAVVTI
jgi:hypothetical protein